MKIRKFMCPLAIVNIAITPLTTITTSCGNKYSQLVNNVVNKLVEMGKYPRCTSRGTRKNLDPIRAWIMKELTSMNYSLEDLVVDDYGNAYFDIPATTGYENYNPLILQGHMDMVVAGVVEELKATKTIDIVVDWDKGLVHSRDYKTSIGADNGVALAIIFTLLQDNSFKHGPLRILFTADEDSGLFGANWIAQHNPQLINKMGKDFKGKDIKYLLNIDSEQIGEVVRSCTGSETFDFGGDEIEVGTDTKFSHTYYLDIRGLKGGHSGIDINNDIASAEKLIYEALYAINNKDPEHPTDSIQLIDHTHPNDDGEDVSFQRNQIVSYGRVFFNSDEDISNIQTIIDKKIKEWKTRYSGEDWNKVSIKIMQSNRNSNEHLSASKSSELIALAGQNKMATATETTQNVWFGYENNAQGKLSRSGNIAPVIIKYDNTKNKYHVSLVTQIRCKTKDVLDDTRAYYEGVKLYDKEPLRTGYYPVWFNDGSIKNEMIDIVMNAYKQCKVEPYILDGNGGLENTWWAYCNPNIQETSIGPTIEGAHKESETLHIDTIQKVLDTVKLVCEAMKN